MRAGLDTSPGTIQWVVSGYALAFGLTLVAGGRLGDAYGRRRLMLIGLTGFVAVQCGRRAGADRRARGGGPAGPGRVRRAADPAELRAHPAAVPGRRARPGVRDLRPDGVDLGRRPARSSAARSSRWPARRTAGAGCSWSTSRSGWSRWWRSSGWCPASRPTDAERDARVDVPGALLLGAAVLCLLYPLVSVEGGARLPLLLLAGAPLFCGRSCAGSSGSGARGHPPLLDVSLLRELPGYGNGLAVGALYFTGFTGIFLVLSVYLQEGLDLSPLQAGLLLTPFALGSAVTAPIAGRIVSRIGRRVTVIALSVMMTGILLVALLVPGRDVATLGWFLVPTLLLAGLGGGGSCPRTSRSAWPRSRRAWAAPRAAHCRPASGSGRRSAPRC